MNQIFEGVGPTEWYFLKQENQYCLNWDWFARRTTEKQEWNKQLLTRDSSTSGNSACNFGNLARRNTISPGQKINISLLTSYSENSLQHFPIKNIHPVPVIFWRPADSLSNHIFGFSNQLGARTNQIPWLCKKKKKKKKKNYSEKEINWHSDKMTRFHCPVVEFAWFFLSTQNKHLRTGHERCT